jgi:hypothetical protein
MPFLDNTEVVTDPSTDTLAPDDGAVLPSYLLGADNHSRAAGSGSWLDGVKGVLESVANAPKYWSLALGSGLTGMANTGIAVANWASQSDDKIEELNYGKWVNDYDSDLGKYYRDNADSIDTAGFLLTSLVPGTVGVKALNLTQKAMQAATLGRIGSNMSAATRLLAPSAESYLTSAAETIAASGQKLKFMQSARLKAIGVGLGQGVLESTAFETFALASQFKNPFFEDMDASDIAINFGTNAVLGGVLMGGLGILGVNKAIKGKVLNLDNGGATHIAQGALSDGSPANLQLTQSYLNREAAEQFIARASAPVPAGTRLPDGATAAIVAKRLSDAKALVADLNNGLRVNVQNLTKTPQVANTFADAMIAADSRAGANLSVGIEGFYRFGDRPLLKTPRGEPGQGSLNLRGGSIEDRPSIEDPTIQWNTLWGEDGRHVMDGKPLAPQLADIVPLKGRKDTIADAVARVAGSFKHTIGKPISAMSTDANLTEIQSRYFIANKRALSGPQVIQDSDLPFLEQGYLQFDKVGKVTVVDAKKNELGTYTNKDDLLKAVVSIKKNQIDGAIRAAKGKPSDLSLDEIAERANVRRGYVNGTGVADNDFANFFNRQALAAEMKTTPEELFYKPQLMGTKTNVINSADVDGLALDSETLVASQRKANQVTLDNATEYAASIYGQAELTNAATGITTMANYMRALPEAEVVQQGLESANRYGTGPRLFSFSNDNYGTLGAVMSHIGNIKHQMDRVANEIIGQKLDSAIRLLRSDSNVAAEYGVTKELVARSEHPLTLIGNKLVPVDPAFRASVKPIELKNPGTVEVWQSHIGLNGSRIDGYKTLRAASGIEDDRSPLTAYAIKPDPAKTPYFVWVEDRSITGPGRLTMLHANSARDLEALVAQTKANFPEWKIITKDGSEAYHKALGDFEFDRSIHENRIDSQLKSRGIMSSPMPRTDGNFLADELMGWHLNQSRAYNAEIIHTKYDMQFKDLEAKARTFGNLDAAKYPTPFELASSATNNPYMSYVKAALNISTAKDLPLLASTNQILDAAVSRVWNEGTKLFRSIKGVDKGQLDLVNDVYAQHGFKPAFKDAAEYLNVNHPAGTNVLTKFIRGASSALATTFLRLDWLNAINNKLGSIILTSTELRHVIAGIEKGDSSTVGKLAQLTKTGVPGTDDLMLSPTKMISNSLRRFIADISGPDKGVLGNRYKELGLDPGLHAQAGKLIENLTISGVETPVQLMGKLEKIKNGADKLIEVGEKATFNRLFEHMNRFMSADIMSQLTDMAVGAGKMTEREAKSYVTTFVNRTQVNLNAAQRPLIFQGPIGMALGLFQSYQFNLMQQLFRYSAPGARKDAAFLMGLQGSIYGMNGLPGFAALNQYISTMAGNTEHRDITDVVTEGGGHDMGNMLLYGMPSNLLRANLYNRGDLTPQNPTVLPTSIKDLPAVAMYADFLRNLKNVASNVAQGADLWPTILQGLEHNGINRPLAGLAQTLRGMKDGTAYSTDRFGNILATNDVLSLATLARLSGGKPLDEALVRSEAWRMQTIKAAQQQQLKAATQALQVTLASGAGPDDGQMQNVFDVFVNSGHKQIDFNRWMMNQYKNSTTSKSEQLREKLNSPLSQRMQILMGGSEETGGVAFGM